MPILIQAGKRKSLREPGMAKIEGASGFGVGTHYRLCFKATHSLPKVQNKTSLIKSSGCENGPLKSSSEQPLPLGR